jgi:hypothetical protein
VKVIYRQWQQGQDRLLSGYRNTWYLEYRAQAFAHNLARSGFSPLIILSIASDMRRDAY